MKKIVAFTLLLCMVLALSACGDVKITMQEVYDAAQPEAVLKNHESVYVRSEVDGELLGETYLTKDYVYDYIYDEQFSWVELITDDAIYRCDGDDYVYYVYVIPDGVTNFASEREKFSASVIVSEDTADEIIESVSKKDGRITVTSSISEKTLENMAEFGMISGRAEYVLDAKTREIVSITSDSAYDDGTSFSVYAEVTYDAPIPEKLKTLLAYESQTENLRNVTIVSNPATEKEETKTIAVPKGLIMGFEYDDAFDGAVAFYTDAACTKDYDPYANTDSDMTIYVKWTNS